MTLHPAVVRPRVPSEGRRHQRCTESKGPEELVVVIANPGTLKPGKDCKANPNTSGITTRAVELGEKFYQAGADVIGIRESRVRAAGVADGEHYCMFRSSAADQGVDGSQLWVRNH